MREAGRPRGQGAARSAILRAADQLFYLNGCAATSLQAVANAAGVTRRTLYYHFASKEALVGEYLVARDRASRRLVESSASILDVFATLETLFRTREFRGCALTNAVGENYETVVVAGPITERHKRALRDWFVSASRASGASDPHALGEQLMLLFDGALVSARTRHDPSVARHARAAAAALLRAQGAQPPIESKAAM